MNFYGVSGHRLCRFLLWQAPKGDDACRRIILGECICSQLKSNKNNKKPSKGMGACHHLML